MFIPPYPYLPKHSSDTTRKQMDRLIKRADFGVRIIVVIFAAVVLFGGLMI